MEQQVRELREEVSFVECRVMGAFDSTADMRFLSVQSIDIYLLVATKKTS